MPPRKAPPAPSAAASGSQLLYLLFPVVVTALVFIGVSGLGWTNWDDDVYILDNPLIKEIDIKKFFTGPSAGTYNPLVILSWAIEWNLVGEDPFLYHINNLILHLGCLVFVFLVLKQLGLDPLWASLGALLFGIHPLKVESVAWVTERKDVLYALFYLAAIWQYLLFLEKKKRLNLLLTFALFVISLFCKIQAVTLAPVLLLLDWYKGRKFSAGSIIEKIPFFAAALAIGLLGIYFLKEGNVVNIDDREHTLAQRFVFGFYAYTQYLIKFLVPYVTCTYYPQPAAPGPIHYILFAAAFAIMGYALIKMKKMPALAFAIGFFTINVILLLQIAEAGSAFMADRFTYIAYLGPVFFLGLMLQELIKKKPGLKIMVTGGLLLGLAVYGAATVTYVKAWENSDTLWSDVIEKYPEKVVVSYVNRGHYLRRNGEGQRAFEDFNTAIRLKPTYALGFLNRGNIYFDRNDTEKAKKDYLEFIRLKKDLDTSGLKPDEEAGNSYGNLGAIYAKTRKYDTALVYLNIAVRANPSNPTHLNNRGQTYFEMGRYAESTADFNTSLRIKPDNPDIINAVGVNEMRQGRYQQAREYFNKAISIKPAQGVYYMNRCYAAFGMKDMAAARSDAAAAQQRGINVNPQFIQELNSAP